MACWIVKTSRLVDVLSSSRGIEAIRFVWELIEETCLPGKKGGGEVEHVKMLVSTALLIDK